jgi:hypothetical protein
MKFSSLVILGSVAVLFSACAKSDQNRSVEAGGYCSQSFVTSYNSVVFELNSLRTLSKFSSDAEVMAKAQSVSNACGAFFSKHSGVSCKAEVDYRSKNIGSGDFQVECDNVNKLLSPRPI